jgi:hypothetical protein
MMSTERTRGFITALTDEGRITDKEEEAKILRAASAAVKDDKVIAQLRTAGDNCEFVSGRVEGNGDTSVVFGFRQGSGHQPHYICVPVGTDGKIGEVRNFDFAVLAEEFDSRFDVPFGIGNASSIPIPELREWLDKENQFRVSRGFKILDISFERGASLTKSSFNRTTSCTGSTSYSNGYFDDSDCDYTGDDWEV